MKPVGWIALVASISALLLLYVQRKPYVSSMAQRNYNKRIEMLAPQIGQQGVRDGYEVVTGAILIFQDDELRSQYADRLEAAKRELRRLAADARDGADVGEAYPLWLEESRRLLAEAKGEPIVRDEPQPPPQPEAIKEPTPTRPRGGRTEIVLNEACYGACKILIHHKGVEKPDVIQLNPGEGFRIGAQHPVSIRMEKARPYCAAPEVRLAPTPEDRRVTVGCSQ